ncbi:hypothetical protein ACSN7O_004740 [Enterobacter chuandaensis]
MLRELSHDETGLVSGGGLLDSLGEGVTLITDSGRTVLQTAVGSIEEAAALSDELGASFFSVIDGVAHIILPDGQN